MLITLHPTYSLRVTVQPPDGAFKVIRDDTDHDGVSVLTRGKFWDQVKNGTGCDAVLEAVRKALTETELGPHVTVRFERYEERGR